MKKWKKIAILSAVTLCLVGTIFYFGQGAKAATPVISDIQVTDITHISAKISWKTDIAAQGKVTYGEESGNLIYQTPTTVTGTAHSVDLSRLRVSTNPLTYYYKITAYSNGEEVSSSELSFTLLEPPAPTIELKGVQYNESQAYINFSTNFVDIFGYRADYQVQYGRTSGSYDYSVAGFDIFENALISDLWANTTYYYRVKAYAFYTNDEYYSGESSFTTLSEKPAITSISPTSGGYGTTITAIGHGFGDQAGLFTIGYDYLSRDCINPQTTIISWSDTKIVAKLKDSYSGGMFNCDPKTGKVKAWSQGYTSYSGPATSLYIRIAEGPIFTITGSSATNANANTNTTLNINASPNAKDIINKYGCNYSTIVSDKNTVKVTALFKEGSEADIYLGNVYNKYKEIWNRYPRCDELAFHLNHSTPLATLTTWLQDNIVKEAYGCKYSITVSDNETVKVKKAFGGDSDTDIYLARVYDEYSSRWGREPRCDELQFHLDHNTPIDSLIVWLDQNKSASTTPSAIAVLSEATVAGVSIDLSLGESLSFSTNQEITFSGTAQPNSIVIITINSEPSVFTVMSNSEGKWSYTLEKNKLSAGTHTITVALADKDLNKIEEGGPISFTVKAATAEKTTVEETTDWISDYWWLLVIGTIVLIVIIWLVGKGIKKES